jgi:hypothetical protein
VIATFEVSGVEIFDCVKMTIENFALDEPGFIDLLRHVSQGRVSIDCFVILLVDLPEGGPVE